MTGSIDDIRIWNTARTSQEVIDNFDNELSGTENSCKTLNNTVEKPDLKSVKLLPF
jgi:hypothetical protein